MVAARRGRPAIVAGVDEVIVDGSRFTPSAVEVPVGTTVTWHFPSAIEHAVVSDDGPGSPLHASGMWQRTPDAPGEHRYWCAPNPFKDGRLTVR